MLARMLAASTFCLLSACTVRATPTEFDIKASVREGTLIVQLAHTSRSCGWNIGRTFFETLEIGDDAVAMANGVPMKVLSTRCSESWAHPWFSVPMSELQRSLDATGQLTIWVTASGETATWRFEEVNSNGSFVATATQEQWNDTFPAVFRWEGPREPNSAMVEAVDRPLLPNGEHLHFYYSATVLKGAISVVPRVRLEEGNLHEPKQGVLPADTYAVLAEYGIVLREANGNGELWLRIQQPLTVTTTR